MYLCFFQITGMLRFCLFHNESELTMFSRLTHSLLMSVLLAALLPTAQAADCPSCAASAGSENISVGAGIVVLGSLSVVAAGGSLIVDSVQHLSDGLLVVLKASGTAASTTIKLSGQGIEKAALVSGAAIEVSATATGYLLMAAGKALAFIPNEAGKALLQHNKAP